jgi:hypothetical protein
MITRNNFDLPVFEYYGNGGSYSGCRRGTGKDDFNYHIFVNKNDDGKEIIVKIWYGIYNLENSEENSSEKFTFDEAGLLGAYDCIDSAYDIWAKDHTPILIPNA